jgi:hypothetical protein
VVTDLDRLAVAARRARDRRRAHWPPDELALGTSVHDPSDPALLFNVLAMVAEFPVSKDGVS